MPRLCSTRQADKHQDLASELDKYQFYRQRHGGRKTETNPEPDEVVFSTRASVSLRG